MRGTTTDLHGTWGRAISRVFRGVFVAALCAALVFYVGMTLHWPMLVDSPVMHYVTFLTEHGFRPYRDITDNNMPGAYLLERCAMFVFGGSDLGWRLYDFFLLAALMACMVIIAWPYDWLSGVYAGGLFALRHGSEGAWFAAEREQEMAVLLVGSCACLFLAGRRLHPAWVAGFGVLSGMAISIKPTLLPFGLLAVGVLVMALRRRQIPWRAYVSWGAIGLCAVFAIDLLFLIHYDAFRSFLFVLRTVTPVYAVLNHPGKRFLLVHMAPFEFLVLAGFALIAFAVQRRWNWEYSVLLIGALGGLFSYFAQGKGFYHHRYIFLCFALLLVSLLIVPLSGVHAGPKWIGYAGLLYALAFAIPREIQAMRSLPGSSALTTAMEGDLTRLGGASALQRQVQCFDLTFGCLNSLYHLGIVENTGFTGDLLLFLPESNPATTYYRNLFWRAQTHEAAGVLVVTNQDFGHENSFDRLQLWPQFQSYLAKNYDLAVSRSFPYEDKFQGQPPAPARVAPTYRIYLRKGQSFAREAMMHSPPGETE